MRYRIGETFIAVGPQRIRSYAEWISSSATGSALNACTVRAVRNSRSAVVSSMDSGLETGGVEGSAGTGADSAGTEGAEMSSTEMVWLSGPAEVIS